MTEEEMKERIDFIENNPASSYWIKKAWEGLKDRDIVDAMEDVELLAEIMFTRWNIQRENASTLKEGGML